MAVLAYRAVRREICIPALPLHMIWRGLLLLGLVARLTCRKLGVTVRLVVRAAAQKQDTTNDNRRNAGPQGHIDVLLFTYGHVKGTYVGLMGRFGVGKSAIGEPQGARHNQHECCYFARIHFNLSCHTG
jgi:hypothetical protein